MTEKATLTTLESAAPQADEPRDDAPVLTVIVPVYNEAATIFELLARVLSAPYAKQVIVVDDGSRDGTAEVLSAWRDQAQFEFLRHEGNRGRGAAIRTGLKHARGRFTIIQDADLEYDPEDYPLLIEPLLADKVLEVPIRFQPRPKGESFVSAAQHARFGGRSLPAPRMGRFPRAAGERHRWDDGLHALATLWRWRRWWTGRKIKVALIVGSGPKAGMEIPVSTPEFRIGRGDRCHVRLLGGSTAELHCLISLDHGSATLVALKDPSYARGTFVNGQPAHRCALRNYDRIKIASLEFHVRLTAEEMAAEEAAKGDSPIFAAKDACFDGCTPSAAKIGTVPLAADDGETQIVLWIDEADDGPSPPLRDITAQYAGPPTGPREKREAAAADGPETESDELEEGRKWKLPDVLLMTSIVNLGLVLLLSCSSKLSAWQGYGGCLLAVLASVVTLRVTRVTRIKLGALNQAFGVLAVLVAGLILPASGMWRCPALLSLAALGVLLGVYRLRTKGVKRREGNLLDLLGILALFFAGVISNSQGSGMFCGSQGWRIGETAILLLCLAPFLALRLSSAGFIVTRSVSEDATDGPRSRFGLRSSSALRLKRTTGRRSDKVLSLLAAIGIFLVAVLGFLFPTPTWRARAWNEVLSWPNSSWLWFRRAVLPSVGGWGQWIARPWSWFRYDIVPHWSEIWWCRWGLVAILAGVVIGLLRFRGRRR